MIDLKYLPVHFTLFLGIGIILGNRFDFSIYYLFTIVLISLSYLVFLYHKVKSSFEFPLKFVGITWLIFLIIGILNSTIRKPAHQKLHYVNHLSNKNKSFLKLTKILKPTAFYNRYEANILQVNSHFSKGKVLVRIKKNGTKKELKIDDLLYTNNDFKKIRKALNPNEFNYRKYLSNLQIYRQLDLADSDYSILASNTKSLSGIAQSIRTNINKELKKAHFAKDELAIINALLLGQRQYVSNKQMEQYKNAGAIHLLAVSGLHIGVILLFLSYLFKPISCLKNGKILKLIVIVFCLWMYAVLAGLSASIIRSVAMFTAIAIGLASNRPFGVQYSLVISLFVLLLLNPFYLFEVGFQLSYIAVFSILSIQPILKGLWKPKSRVLNYFWSLLTVSFAAQIGVLPLSLFYFHMFPGLFFISSLLIIPFLGLVLGLGFLIILLALLKILPLFLSEYYEVLIKTMNNSIAFISYQENFIFKNIALSTLTMTASYAIIIFGLIWINNKSIIKLYLFILSILFLQLSFIYEKYQRQSTNQFIVFHQIKKSIIANKLGNKLTVFCCIDSEENAFSPLESYRVNMPNLSIQIENFNKNILEINSKRVLIIDRLGIYKGLNFNPEIVILTQSPKININRMLEILEPRLVIVDGSNFSSYINSCEKSCEIRSITFHNSSKNGAFIYHY